MTDHDPPKQIVHPVKIVRARRLRKKQTRAEYIFWQIVRDRRLLGLKFRRQHPIGSFIVDFYCHELSLVVEVDGPIHDQPNVIAYDNRRSLFLESLGLKIIRFKNDEVLYGDECIVLRIKELMK
jgi:very-short-patch-repair endonuclease